MHHGASLFSHLQNGQNDNFACGVWRGSKETIVAKNLSLARTQVDIYYHDNPTPLCLPSTSSTGSWAPAELFDPSSGTKLSPESPACCQELTLHVQGQQACAAADLGQRHGEQAGYCKVSRGPKVSSWGKKWVRE